MKVIDLLRGDIDRLSGGPHRCVQPLGSLIRSHGRRFRGGRHPVSPWGFPTKGAKTRGNKRTDNMIVRRRK